MVAWRLTFDASTSGAIACGVSFPSGPIHTVIGERVRRRRYGQSMCKRSFVKDRPLATLGVSHERR